MITLMGAAPDTGNQGVSALCASAIDGLRQRGMTQIAVADHGRGRRVDSDGTQRFGLTHHRRLWRSDCLRVVHAMAPFGGGLSVSARTIAQSNAVLDVSGGDSFTDLYGPKRFGAMTLSKRAALRAGRPLILLPQTIGPFKGDTARKEATAILRRATAIWVRDARSEQILRDLLQDDYDPARHQRGPDMAVLLPAQKPANLPAEINDVLSKHTAAPLAGLNVSGLLCQQDDDARRQFGLADSHRHQSEAVARAVLDSDPTMRLVLVSHVQRPTGDMESDHDAACALAERLSQHYPQRVFVLPQQLSATELKWVIGRLDWFAGARMHATIAAFSSGVPTLGLGYSDKAAGVFDECGLTGHVADLRQLDAGALAERTAVSIASRAALKTQLAQILPGVKASAEATMDGLAQTLQALRA